MEKLEARTLPAGVRPVNHAPTDVVLANGYVLENSPAGTLVGHFGTADPDPGERFTYSIAGRFSGMFRVDGDRLLTNGALDFETRNSYPLLVLAVDSRGASISRQVTIQVMDQLENPLDSGGLQLITRPHRDIPPSDSVANGVWINASGIAGSEVVFISAAPNLILGDTNGRIDVFVASQRGKMERISVSQSGQEANDDSVGAKISRNGRWVAFISSATNLVTGDSNERSDVFVRDRLLGTTQRISLRNDRTQFSEGGVTEVAISANGRFVAFVVETSSGFQKNEGGLYVRDLLRGTTKRLIATSDGEPYPGSISISGDGQRIAYSLYEQSATQVHVVDRLTSAIQLVSVSRLGTVRPESSSGCMISENGRFVVFESEAAGLVEGGETMQGGVFIRDLLKNTTQRVDLANDGSAPGGSADSASISADGRFVAFRSLASNLSPPDSPSPSTGPGYFVRDLRTGQTQPVVVALDGNQPQGPERIAPLVSNDGRYVAFQHFVSNLVPRDGNSAPDLFLRDTRTNTTELLTRRHPGLPSATSLSYYGSVSSALSLNTDGSQVLFTSASTTLTPDLIGSPPYQFDPKLFIRDLKSPGDIEHLSFTTYSTSVSRNGRFVLFETYDSLVPEDTQYGPYWYVLDRETGTYTRVNLSNDGSRVESFIASQNALSDDGRYVVFQSSASNVVAEDTNGQCDIFVRDLLQGTTTRVSVASDGTEANGYSDIASLSLDGRFVVFASTADNLVPDDHNRTFDVFVHDQFLGTTERVSVNSDGQEGDSYSFSPLISGDRRCVAFRSYSTNLANGLVSSDQIYWHDRLTGATQLISVTHGLPGWASLNSISNDGRFVVFESGDSNFVAGDTNRVSDVLRAVTI